jgi:hypothetical protein
LSTGLDPAMTLGCGGFGGNITSDNISPRHLLNIKRVAYEVTPTVSRWDRQGLPYDLPTAPAKPPASTGISADALSRRIDQFLGSRGFKEEPTKSTSGVDQVLTRCGGSSGSGGSGGSGAKADEAPLDFVCEEDVRLAIQAGRKLVVSERAIVTPAARDMGEQHRVFSVAPWRG